MTDPRNISILDYSYLLPEKRIAHYPLPERDASKLLIYKDGKISADIYRNITTQLPENSLLIFNNTKVIEARLLFKKTTGAIVEIFCLEPDEQYPDITTAMLQKEKVWWKCLVGGASKWKKGHLLEKKITDGQTQILLQAGYVEKKDGSFTVELSWSPSSMSFAELLHHAGAVPLPPYIKRLPEHSDRERYQTVYAEEKGSVAAPTAGLHFTNLIFSHLDEKKIRSDFVTLHVGAGTFKPVKSETLHDHEMHAEWIDVSRSTIENILNNLAHAIITVGTTSLRTIESLYWLGVKSLESRHSEAGRDADQGGSTGSQESMILEQWEVYELPDKNIPVKEALEGLLKWMDENKLGRLVSKTKIMIVPGYEFRIVKALVTNFHQPQSTLLLLVAALIGDDWKKVYNYALQHDFRFLSYGDGSLLWHPPAFPKAQRPV